MNPISNNEEADEIMQWPEDSGPFTSLEGFTGINIDQVCAYYHRGTFPSANVSSLLCSEAFQHEPGWASTGAISQMPEPPQQHDLHCLSPSYSITVENTVKCLADDLGSPNLTQRPLDNLRSESTVRPTGGLDRTMLGIPTSTPLSLQPSLEDVMDQVVASFRDLLYNQTSSPDRILQALQHIETIKNFFGSKLSLPSTSSTGSSERGRKLFQCWQCDPQKDKTTFSKFGTFKRHLTKHDILDCGWRCPEPGCSVVVHRRDKMHDHLLLKHKKISLTPANVEATRERYPHPPSCRFCSRKISSWFMYFKHIKYHCLIPTGSTNAPTDEDWSCHGDNGGGNVGYGDSHCHGSSFAGPSNSNGDTSLTDQANGLGGLTDSSISSERFGSVDRFSIDDPLGPSRRSEPHFPRGSRQPNNLQPPQNLGSSRADPSTKRKRSAKQNTIQQERRQLA